MLGFLPSRPTNLNGSRSCPFPADVERAGRLLVNAEQIFRNFDEKVKSGSGGEGMQAIDFFSCPYF